MDNSKVSELYYIINRTFELSKIIKEITSAGKRGKYGTDIGAYINDLINELHYAFSLFSYPETIEISEHEISIIDEAIIDKCVNSF
jgi:hypothetical protein